MNSPKWLEELEAKARAATQGEWKWNDRWGGLYANDDIRIIETDAGFYPPKENDQAHIAANSPAHVLALCKLIREMGEALEGAGQDTDYYPGADVDNILDAYQRGPVVEKDGGEKE